MKRVEARHLPIILALVGIGAAIVNAWYTTALFPTRTPPRDRAEMRQLAGEFRALAGRERRRVWATPGHASRQATWNLAKALHALQRCAPPDADTPARISPVPELRIVLERLLVAEAQSRLGRRSMVEEPGPRLRAYVSDIDGTLQTYSVSVPAAYDPDVSWPLVVSLHGHGWFRPFQGHPAPEFRGAFCLSPQGRGATDYMELGEQDVLQSLAEVRRDFSIDPDRIVVTGRSMGGTGAWHLGVHAADLFAAAVPIAGNADHRAWGRRWAWNQPFAGRFDALRDWLLESHAPRAYARNLRHLPVFVLHGSGDTIVPPEHARFMVQALRDGGATVEYREFPDVGHGGFADTAVADALAWACGQRREAAPSRVTWRAARLRHGKAWWLRFEQLAQPGAFATIDAEIVEPGQVRIRTENLRAFSLERAADLFAATTPLFLDIDGDNVRLAAASEYAARWVRLECGPERGWQVAESAPAPGTLRKTLGTEGPVSEALLAPFILVLGTQAASPLMRQLWHGEVQAFLHEWRRRNGGPCFAVRDVDLTPAQAATHNLVLFGGPNDNAVAARLAHGLPLAELAAQAMRVMPADRRDLDASTLFSAADVGLILVHPNPHAPQRLVVMLAGGGPAAVYQGWKRFGNWFNWGVFDSYKYFDAAFYDARTAAPETYLLVGNFDADWRVAGGVWHGGDADLRAAMGAQSFPPHDTLPTNADTVALVHVRPVRIDQMRGAVGFGRSFHGEPLAHGLGVRAPATLEYQLDGNFRHFSSRVALRNSPGTGLPVRRRQNETVNFIVVGDGKELASVETTWKKPEATLRVDLRGVRRLRLEARVSRGPAWLHAEAAWLEPHLTR